jgi:hypothetical protein
LNIRWRLSGSSSEFLAAGLAHFGVIVPKQGFFSVLVDEGPGWARLQEWLNGRDDVIVVATTEFSKSELESARNLRVFSSWHWGYPQPEDDFPSSKTYDLSSYCGACGVGAIQVRPFILKGEPRWGSRSLLSLNWVFGELFVKPEVWRALLLPLGVKARPVLDGKSRTLTQVVQVEITESVELDVSGLTPMRCPDCTRIKYEWPVRGYALAPIVAPEHAIARSTQWFGSGAAANNSLIASAPVYSALKELAGVSFQPVAPR